jgi:glycerol-3-phosphate O-acyltransferase
MPATDRSDRRPIQEAENRLASFNRERNSIIAEVERRVLAGRLDAAGAGGDASIEYVLNDVAFQEIRRLERGPASEGEKKRLPEWRDLARRLGTMSDDERRRRLSEQVGRYARDIAGSFSMRVFRFATSLLPSLLSGILAPASLLQGVRHVGDLSGKVIVDGPTDHIRACADRGTLVVVPTHSSNMDSVVIGWSMHRAGLPPVTYGAGKNLFTNPLISYFMHNLGAYRVDRRLGNLLYKDVLKAYSTVLLERGFHSLFFPGGTRSRSGSVEKRVKLGLLGTALNAYADNLRRGEVQRRIYVIPATINYGIVLEAETLIDDFLAEEGKHRYIIEDDEFSRLGRVLDFTRRILSMEGALHIRYGAPLDLFGNKVDEAGDSHDARGRLVDPATYMIGPDGQVAADPQRDAEYTKSLGDEIVREFRRLTVFMPTHLVARAIFDRVAKATGTRDVYMMLRTYEGTEIPAADVCADLLRIRDTLAQRPGMGELPERFQRMRPSDMLDDALLMFRGYHTRPVVEKQGERLLVRDMRLVYYYQNRTAHIPPEVLS